MDKTVNYGFDLISTCEMFTPREHDFLGKIFLSLGSPGGTLVLNENVSFPHSIPNDHCSLGFVLRF